LLLNIALFQGSQNATNTSLSVLSLCRVKCAFLQVFAEFTLVLCAFKTKQDYEYSGGNTTTSRVVKISTLGFFAYVDRSVYSEELYGMQVV
ncbi:MAG TPA: hypothetical protein VF393_03590, partial [archaeon]